MMRRLSYLLLMAVLLLSCQKEPAGWDGPYIEFSLSTGNSVETRGTDVYEAEGIDRYLHENLISTVDFFFYPDGNTSADATYHARVTSGKTKSDIIRLPFTSEAINTLIFPYSATEDVTTCEVFAVVNFPGEDPLVPQDSQGKDILTGTSLEDLHQIEVTTNFVYPAGSGSKSHYHPNFMMSGFTTLTLRGRNQILSASGAINLERYACKMTVGLNISPQVVVGNEVWEPFMESMELYLVDVVGNVRLLGDVSSPAYFNYKSNAMKYLNEDSSLIFEKDGDYMNTYPFYMYPQKWIYGSTQSPNTEPYLKLVLPWRRVIGQYAQKQFYYKIVIPNDRRPEYVRQFVRNNWYHIDVDVSMLGAETDEASVPVSGSVYVVYWQDKNVVIKNAEIGKARYLSIDQEDQTENLWNVASTTIPYVTSHPVVMQDLRATRLYYGTVGSGSALGGTVKTAGANDIYPSGSKYLEFELEYDESDGNVYYLKGGSRDAVWATNTGTGIEFNHPLNNDYTDPTFDYSPYIFSYTLVHADHSDDATYRKSKTIVQYPGIYLEKTKNPDHIVESGSHPSADHWGYVYINGEQYTEPTYNADGKPADKLWMVVAYNGDGTDMYRINATVLPPDSEFVIGDPRSLTVSNPRSDYCTAPAIEGGTRTLLNYYPADETDRTVHMIAPAFRISTKLSGAAKNTEITHEQAVQRCAALQENGFPAGRWRLPTKGEISFAAQLSANGVFTKQFDNNYWSANGVIYVNKTTNEVVSKPDKTTAFIRCVYDSWYWGDDRVLDGDGLPTIFTWGDAARR